MSDVTDVIRSLRKYPIFSELDERKMHKNPLPQFEQWMHDALNAEISEPNAMTVATADGKGAPDARIVLLRGFDKNGFSFFTNYKSRKGKEIASNKKVCLNFFWSEISRQVRIRGTIEMLSAKASDEYFNSRPRESQIGAWASSQSEVLKSRKELEKKFLTLAKKFEGKEIPRPPHWGGYLVKPNSIEFWQGRESRLHDRIVYTKQKGQTWAMARLSP